MVEKNSRSQGCIFMKDYQFFGFLWALMMIVYYCSPEQPLGALISGFVFLLTAMIHLIKDSK
jgi:hypothetical protein